MSAAHSRGMRASTTFQSMTDLKPGVGITVDGRPATVISLGVGPAGRPARFVQLEDGQVIRVERATCRGFDLQVTADDPTLSRAARLINLGMARPVILERRVHIDRYAHVRIARIAHLAGCTCVNMDDTRSLGRDEVISAVLSDRLLWAECATSAARVDPEPTPDRIDMSTLVGRPVNHQHGIGRVAATQPGRVQVVFDGPPFGVHWLPMHDVTLLAEGA